jgi:pimeloyl-ACP methyl ester carboxylesterase
MEPLPTPRKLVNYPLPNDDENGGVLYLYGESNSPALAIFCAGYPDDHEHFLPFASRLAKETNTFVGVMCLPGYDDRPDKPWKEHKKEGYSFNEWVSTIRVAVKALRSESTHEGGRTKLIGFFHDWGVIAGSIWANRTVEEGSPDAPDELVLFDVLGPPHPEMKDVPQAKKPSVNEIVVTLAYRIVLGVSFGLQLYMSKALALVFFIIGFIPLGILRLSPLYKIDSAIIEARKGMTFERKIYMAYPYFYMLKSILLGRSKTDFTAFSLPLDLNKTPVLYMFGTCKRIMFHDFAAVHVLEREAKEGWSKSDAVAVDHAGHWLYIHQKDACMEAVKAFMSKKK